jgi:hypothetical protein
VNAKEKLFVYFIISLFLLDVCFSLLRHERLDVVSDRADSAFSR